MSGDVQPRKRKDKRRKKDEVLEDVGTLNPEEVIHVQKDALLGGNICAKIVFFCLLGALGVMVGLIIIEYRGSNDIETQSAVDSPWSQMLDGWVDTNADAHHDDHHDDDDEDEGIKEDIEIDDEDLKPIPGVTVEEEEAAEEEDDDEETSGGVEDPASKKDTSLNETAFSPEEDVPEILSRRKTLVPPSILDDLQPARPPSRPQDEFPEEEADEEEDEEEEEEEEDEDIESEHMKKTLEELKATYGDITPEPSDVEEEYSRQPAAKSYTYTPTPPESEPEQSEPEEEDVQEEEEEEDDPMQQWQSKQAAHLLAEEVEDVQTGSEEEEEEEEEESDDEPPPPPVIARRKGPQGEDEEQLLQDIEPLSTEELVEQPAKEVQSEKVELPTEDVNVLAEAELSDEALEIPAEEEQPATEVDQPEEPTFQDYFNAEFTNNYDWDIHEELDAADAELNQGHADRALSMFTSLLAQAPKSARARHGKARAYDQLAEAQHSNALLIKAIAAYHDAINAPDIPDALFIKIANRTIDRMRFKGTHMDAVQVHNKLIVRFPDDSLYRNQLAVTYLMINRLSDAKSTLEASLNRWPGDGLGNALYGLLLKLQGHHAKAIPHLETGLKSNASGTQESNFYFHLGDALTRVNKNEEAMKVYEDATAKGLLRSKFQRSLYNVDRLTARPWWTPEETTYQEFFRKLENSWKVIRREGLNALKSKKGFRDEAESLREVGDWKQFEIFARGRKSENNCQQTPVTCKLVGEFPPASGCRRGQSKFSVMEGGTHVWAHCGPTNSRLRAHLGLVIPPNVYLRVANETRTWEEGKVLIFDDSFEHEVWHNGTEQRLVLIVDVWHPELTPYESRTLSAI